MNSKQQINKTKQLNIAMFGQKRIPSLEGGVEVVAEELAVRIAHLGHNIVCYNRKDYITESSKKRTEYKGVTLKEVFTVYGKGIEALSSSVIASIKSAFGNYDVVHIHAEGPAFMCWLPKLMGKRVIVTIHGLDHQRPKWGKLAQAYLKAGGRNAAKFADEIIVLSTGLQKYFLENYGRKTVYIPNGVNEPLYRQANIIQREYGLQKDDYILYLGRLVPEKGERYLIEAFRQLHTDKKLVIAGGITYNDPYLLELKKMAKDDKNIIFTGFVEGALKEELYSNAYIYALPSDLEGMPLSLLEAMSYGNCCVTSDITECHEVVKDNAVLFRKSDIDDLKNKLQYLCDHSEIVDQYKSKAHDYIISKFNWDDVVEQTLYLYQGNRHEDFNDK